MMGVGQSSAEWPFLYLFIADVQQLSGSQAERLFSFYCSTWSCRMAIFFFYRSVLDVQRGSGSQAEWSSLLLSNVDAESVFFCCFCGAVRQIFVLYCYIYVYLLSTNISCLLESSEKIAKKKSRLQVQSTILFRVLVRNEEFSIIFIHTRIKFCTLITCNMFQ